MSVYCQPIFRGTIGRITMAHRPQSLDDCAPTLKYLSACVPARTGRPLHKFVSPCKTTLANSRLLPIAKADGFYGLSDKFQNDPSKGS